MYNKNPFTGRLTPATAVHIPTKAVGPVSVEAPAIRYTPGTTFPKQQLGSRPSVPEFLMKKMKVFQAHNSLPIHLKGGPMDKVLFGTTLVLCAAGLAGCFHFYYEMAFPPKKD
ncbi:Cytochrome c oxidase subunit 7A1, mitochondrial [Chionoecetes opilio]|uniref:Cytochrome c oxidase subunit 7A1, mitochondrial n=1 Tax=Chionoecetes opilio TaxID=41210 RepID=A0A8J4Y472_CHIOP|nr:Cytochrome c oxidase subunit 7A1, mitochondrial [Chionoecetes opilio]